MNVKEKNGTAYYDLKIKKKGRTIATYRVIYENISRKKFKSYVMEILEY